MRTLSARLPRPSLRTRFFSTSSSLFTALRNRDPLREAISDSTLTHTNGSLLAQAESLSKRLPAAPIGIFLPPNASFVPALLAVWAAGGTAVPLSPLYPAAAVAPLLETVEPAAIICAPSLRNGLPPLTAPIISPDHELLEDDGVDYTSRCDELAARAPERAMIFFTSGTTGKPKGVVWTQNMLEYQLKTLSSEWRWSDQDRILNVLPLHHIHGLVNVVLSAVYNGAHLDLHNVFDAYSVWSAFMGSNAPTIFMAVPAIYKKLILHYESCNNRDQRAMRDAASRLRLFVCGSAALSKGDFDAWQRISGHRILERYGMTETGMTLSNIYDRRHQGFLGAPLPGVEVRVDGDAQGGQLLIRSPGVFNEYWSQPEITRQSFTEDGFFETGDVVSFDEETGYYKMLGRASSDIIKTGGYKVSALEIEEILRECEGVLDCCVVGVHDDVLGQRIAAAIIMDSNQDMLDDVRRKTEEHLPKYKIPRQYHVVDDLPRNILGKVQKQMLKVRLGI